MTRKVYIACPSCAAELVGNFVGEQFRAQAQVWPCQNCGAVLAVKLRLAICAQVQVCQPKVTEVCGVDRPVAKQRCEQETA